MEIQERITALDQEFCGKLPVNFINLVQPYGFLVIIDKAGFVISQISENFPKELGLSSSDVLNSPIQDILVDFSALAEKLNTDSGIFHQEIQLTGKDTTVLFQAVFHLAADQIIIELEKINEEERKSSFTDVFSKIRSLISLLIQAKDIYTIAEVSVKELKQFSGFDRIMMYKFDEQWNGTVIAEAKEADMDSYLDLRFPASDVPQQVRNLYFKNPYRYIPDVDYIPVKLQPVVNPVTSSFTDLAACNVRAVPAVHIEYLANMKVKSSMSVPLIVDNNLWGLIACHSKKAKNISYETRTAFELLSGVISGKISGKLGENRLEEKSQINAVASMLLQRLRIEKDVLKVLFGHDPTILELLNLSGAAFKYGNTLQVIGETPDMENIHSILEYLRIHNVDRVYCTTCLSNEMEDAPKFSKVASGIIVLPIYSERGDYLIGFRKEEKETVKWSGNPKEALKMESDQKSYHPRNSFDLWKQQVENRSREWSSKDKEIAELVRGFMLEVIVNTKK